MPTRRPPSDQANEIEQLQRKVVGMTEALVQLQQEVRDLAERRRGPAGATWLTAAEVACRLGVSTDKVRRNLQAGTILGVQFDRQWFVMEQEVQRLEDRS
jgi:excisionase family DNA binding protein